MKTGDPFRPISKLRQPHEIIELRFLQKPNFSPEIIKMYNSGFSACDIAKHFSCSKQKVLKTLKQYRINMRPSGVVTTRRAVLQQKAKSGAKAFYGFCYSEGKLIKHPIEFPILIIIHRLWTEGQSIHHINQELNRQKIKSREGCRWSWAAVRNIMSRFKDKIIVLKENGEFEVR